MIQSMVIVYQLRLLTLEWIELRFNFAKLDGDGGKKRSKDWRM